ncbi:MAG: hypothetical protein HPY69_13985 [Armatimonadetes bacterium]|nr:hypothetical protein [Armatimonadota bacterium]
MLLVGLGATAAVTVLLSTTCSLAVAAGFLSGVALGGASVCTLVLLGRAFVKNVTRGRRTALVTLQLAKWPVFAVLIYLLLVCCHVSPVAMALGLGMAMLFGLGAGLRRAPAKADQGLCR